MGHKLKEILKGAGMEKVILIGTSAVAIVMTVLALNGAGNTDKKIEIGTLMLTAGIAGAGAVMALQKTASEISDRLNCLDRNIDERFDRIEKENVKTLGMLEMQVQQLWQVLETHSQKLEQNTQMLQYKLDEVRRHVDERLQLERTINESKIQILVDMAKNDRRWRV